MSEKISAKDFIEQAREELKAERDALNLERIRAQNRAHYAKKKSEPIPSKKRLPQGYYLPCGIAKIPFKKPRKPYKPSRTPRGKPRKPLRDRQSSERGRKMSDFYFGIIIGAGSVLLIEVVFCFLLYLLSWHLHNEMEKTWDKINKWSGKR